jgi:glycine oxidase
LGRCGYSLLNQDRLRADILILGQGLAGTLVGSELERAGISFEIVDPGHMTSATSVAAGIINPITGRRMVKSWNFEKLLPAARAGYRELEGVLGVPLWRDMRIRRIFADERERAMGAHLQERAELSTYIESVDDSGWWIRGAARIDLPALLAATRQRWLSKRKLRTEAIDGPSVAGQHALVIDCRGVSGAKSSTFDFVPWEFSKGELLELELDGLNPGVILNRRTWVLPVGLGGALAGATHEPGLSEATPSFEGRAAIEAEVSEILGAGRPFSVTNQRAGIRVALPDKRPVVGRHPCASHVGLLNGLGGKGALWAPALARQWADHLRTGLAFDAEVDVRRFASPARTKQCVRGSRPKCETLSTNGAC